MYRLLSLFILVAACSCGCAQVSAVPRTEPKIEHAQIEMQSLNGSLQSELNSLAQTQAPLWVGYLVPTEAPYHSGWGRSRVTYLEGGRTSGHEANTSDEPGADDHVAILYRLAGGRVEQLRSASPDETLDAGGLRFLWLHGVSAEESVAALRGVALSKPAAKTAETAAFLISLHRSPAAVPALIELAGAGNDLPLREKAAFWLANQRGHEGFLAIQTFAHQDGDAVFREKLTFDLTLSKDPGAVPELIRIAHEDSSPRVRQQAQFWMAQRGGKLVASTLQDAAERDPDAGVRKQAVFAISRLPQAEATEKLVMLADSAKDPEVRKQAVFWLGQSEDPKALAFLTGLLTTSKR